MALQNQCMKPPPHLFLNKLLKPNTENVWGPPPTSLGNLLILQTKFIQKYPFQSGGGPWKCMKNSRVPPPSSYILRGGGWSADVRVWRYRSADVRVWRCRSADVRVWRCRSADVRVWTCRSADVRVWRCRSADVKVWRCRSADVRVWRCRSADVRVWRCRSANVRVWRCITTAAFLRRTLRRRSREKLK